MKDDRDLLAGIVEADETYIGGKPHRPSRDNQGKCRLR